MSYGYKKLNHWFENGEVLHNDNGYDYRVIDTSMQSEILFERCKDGERVLATMPKMYEKTEDGKTEVVLSWQSGKYLKSVLNATLEMELPNSCLDCILSHVGANDTNYYCRASKAVKMSYRDATQRRHELCPLKLPEGGINP